MRSRICFFAATNIPTISLINRPEGLEALRPGRGQVVGDTLDSFSMIFEKADRKAPSYSCSPSQPTVSIVLPAPPGDAGVGRHL
jgi:hypothetical protein